MKNIALKEKEYKKQSAIYENMVKQHLAEEVQNAQKTVVEKLKVELEADMEYKIRNTEVKDIPITFEIVNEETGEKTETEKHIAFIENNRPIDKLKVFKFVEIIVNNKYETAYPIIVCKAFALIKAGYALKTIEGEVLTEEKAGNYLAFLDGQHKGMALMKKHAADGATKILNVHMRTVENVGEYLVGINTVGNWSTKDKSTVAALTNKRDEFLSAMARAIREGISSSTASKIFCKKIISTIALDNALQGEKYKLPKEANINIDRGFRFIETCKEAGIPVKYISKRYFIDGFNSHVESVTEDTAFENLRKLRDHDNLENECKKVTTSTEFITLLAGRTLLKKE